MRMRVYMYVSSEMNTKRNRRLNQTEHINVCRALFYEIHDRFHIHSDRKHIKLAIYENERLIDTTSIRTVLLLY